MTIDLAEISNCLVVAEKIVNKLVPEPILQDLKSFNPEEMHGDTMSFLEQVYLSYDEYFDIESWFDDLEKAFFNYYTHVRGFHACRIFSGIDSYKKEGICKGNLETLRNLAYVVFNKHSTKLEIDKAVDDFEINDLDKSVYMFVDKISPLNKSCNSYLYHGGENLQMLGTELGLRSTEILNSQGQPYLIECEVPLSDVSKLFYQEWWQTLVTEYFKVAAGAIKQKEPYDFCMKVDNSIAPASIVAFHKVNEPVDSCGQYY